MRGETIALSRLPHEFPEYPHLLSIWKLFYYHSLAGRQVDIIACFGLHLVQQLLLGHMQIQKQSILGLYFPAKFSETHFFQFELPREFCFRWIHSQENWLLH